MEGQKKYNGNVRSLVLLIFLLFWFQKSSAINVHLGDSTKNKYDINDPRNPDCPCHKYQKLADEEYSKLMSSKANASVDQKDNNESKTNGGKKILALHVRSKKRTQRHPGKKSSHRHSRKKSSTKIDKCFNW